MHEALSLYFSQLVAFIHSFTNIVSKGDPVVNGLATLAVLSSLMFLARRIPGRIYNRILVRFSSYYDFTITTDVGLPKLYFDRLGELIREHTQKRRVFSVSFVPTKQGHSLLISAGLGRGFFFLGKGLVIFQKLQKTSKEEKSFSFTFRTFNISDEVFREFLNISPDEKRPVIYTDEQSYRDEFMALGYLQIPEKMNICPDLKKQIDDLIDSSVAMKKEFQQRVINNKLNMLFVGPPGTGKSTLLYYVAQKTGRSVLLLQSPDRIDSGRIGSLISKINPIILIDDVDRNPFLKEQPSQVNPENVRQGKTSANLSAFLNFLDGAMVPNDRIVMMMANSLTDIVPAFYRHNRIDLLYELGFNTKKDFDRCLKFYFPDANPEDYKVPENIQFSNAMCANLYKKHHYDVSVWVKKLLEESDKLNQPTPSPEHQDIKILEGV